MEQLLSLERKALELEGQKWPLCGRGAPGVAEHPALLHAQTRTGCPVQGGGFRGCHSSASARSRKALKSLSAPLGQQRLLRHAASRKGSDGRCSSISLRCFGISLRCSGISRKLLPARGAGAPARCRRDRRFDLSALSMGSSFNSCDTQKSQSHTY